MNLNSEGSENMWALMFDFIKTNPKYERLKNTIESLTLSNMVEIRKRVNKERTDNASMLKKISEVEKQNTMSKK